MEVQVFSKREISNGFQVNLFYHVTKKQLVWMGNNLDLVRSIKTREFPEQLYYTIAGQKIDVSKYVKNLIPATNKNIKAVKDQMGNIPLSISQLAPQLDSSTFSIATWHKPAIKNENLMNNIKRNSVQFKDYLNTCINNNL